MVALAFMHIHEREPAWWMEAEQKGAIIMIGLTIGRFVTIMMYGDLVEKMTKEKQNLVKFFSCLFCLTFCLIVCSTDSRNYNPWWFFMALFLGVQDGVLEHTSSSVAEECEEEEKYRMKCAYFIIVIFAAFFIYLISIALYREPAIGLLSFMIVSLLLGFAFSFKKFAPSKTETTSDSAKMLILPEEEKKEAPKEKEKEKEPEPKKEEPAPPPPAPAKAEDPPKAAEKAPVVAEVKLD
jgi:hypothetical protein